MHETAESDRRYKKRKKNYEAFIFRSHCSLTRFRNDKNKRNRLMML